ncbi:YSIRK-type signal peptide-containing protein, partial [Staphylococcus intermedius]
MKYMKRNKYSIRKFNVGVSSILIGASLIFGINTNDAEAKSEDLFKVHAKNGIEERTEAKQEESPVEERTEAKQEESP